MNSCELSYVWIDQDFRNINWLKTCFNDTLKKAICTRISSTVESSSKCVNYRFSETNFTLESYLLRLPRDLRIPLITIRTCNHRLPIKTGR